MPGKLKVLDLFSGIRLGGFSLGLERTGGFETVAFCEIDPFCQKVLKKHWPNVPIYNDVRDLDYDGPVDVITGGYPCQPFSVAGKRKGQDDDRHLWPAMFELVKKHKPAWVIGENVAGHISMGLDDVLFDLENEGYGARAFVIPACAVDAPHRRDRVWIVANSQSAGKWREIRDVCEADGRPGGALFQFTDSASQDVANAGSADRYYWKENFHEEPSRESSEEGKRCQQNKNGFQPYVGQGEVNGPVYRQTRGDWQADYAFPDEARKWPVEPALDRVVDGIPGELDPALTALGNAVVPQIPEIIGHAILQAEGT